MKGFAGVVIGLAFLFFLLFTNQADASSPSAQVDTPIATVTGTPEGPQILVPDQVNVRLCPSTDCDLVGVLIAGQQASAIGRSPGGDWIQIIYPGIPGNVAWVYSHYVVLPPGQSMLPIVEPPPTTTPRVTSTVDPTLAAQFNLGGLISTPLPTYTAVAPVMQPTFESVQNGNQASFPPVLAIFSLMVLGLFGIVISMLRGTSTGL
jgi:hypothetical protein